MSRFPEVAAALAMLIGPAHAETLGLGREALPEEVAAWNLDVHPGGAGLPAGSGNVATGEEIFVAKCASCHGDFAEGLGNWPKLAGGMDTLDRDDPVKTVGSYWPYLSTAWDYINRSMPYGNAQSLAPDEVYAILAYILYSNYLVADDFVLSDDTFADFDMPNSDGFFIDDRIETEYARWVREPCIENCKDSVEITMHASVLDVTPEDDGGGEAAAPAGAAIPSKEAASPEAGGVQGSAAHDPDLVTRGEKVFRKCKACHQIGEGAENRVGPDLTGVFGSPAGQVEGFGYSSALADMAEDGLVWDDASLKAFLANPREFIKGTGMSFAGLKKEEDLDAITAYLASFPS